LFFPFRGQRSWGQGAGKGSQLSAVQAHLLAGRAPASSFVSNARHDARGGSEKFDSLRESGPQQHAGGLQTTTLLLSF
jgi:hypothetical protein